MLTDWEVFNISDFNQADQNAHLKWRWMYIYEHGSYKDMKVWTVMKNIRTWDVQTRVGKFDQML